MNSDDLINQYEDLYYSLRIVPQQPWFPSGNPSDEQIKQYRIKWSKFEQEKQNLEETKKKTYIELRELESKTIDQIFIENKLEDHPKVHQLKIWCLEQRDCPCEDSDTSGWEDVINRVKNIRYLLDILNDN